MERIVDNIAKTALVTKLFMWAIITLFGALLIALPGIFGKTETPKFKANFASDDPYSSDDEDAANSLALRYL